VDYQLAMKPAGDRPTDYAWSLLMLMKGEHDVSCGRDSWLRIGEEFVELHWVDWNAAWGRIAGRESFNSV
jgi:hypothetical protein